MVVLAPSSPQALMGVESDVYSILSNTLSFTKTQKFWWEATGHPLAKMFVHSGYSVNSQFLHMLFFYLRGIPYLGPLPNQSNQPEFKSYMTDDHTPFEASWTRNSNGKLVVRYVIEPIAADYRDNDNVVVAQMVDALRPTLGHTFDTSWFETLKSALTWHGSPGDMQAKHESQCFIGFDCLHNGDTLVKVYFMPERRAIHMGVPKEQLVTDGLSMLNMDLEGVWRDILRYLDSLPASVRPEVEMVASDFSNPKDNRIKIYVRTRSTCFADFEGLITLGGTLRSPSIDRGIQALTEMWRDIMGVDISSKGWKDTPLSYLPGIKNDHLTGGLILNYELKAGSPHPQVKVYLPVRLYCPNDYKTACKSAKFYGIENQTAHDGIQTYVGLGIKGSSGCEVATYFNPEAYAPERSSQP